MRSNGYKAQGQGYRSTPQRRLGTPVPFIVHDFNDGHRGDMICRVCWCPYDDPRHFTPIKPEDRIFSPTPADKPYPVIEEPTTSRGGRA